MPETTKFQRLYLKHYGKKITREQAQQKRTALVNILRICRQVADKKK